MLRAVRLVAVLRAAVLGLATVLCAACRAQKFRFAQAYGRSVGSRPYSPS